MRAVALAMAASAALLQCDASSAPTSPLTLEPTASPAPRATNPAAPGWPLTRSSSDLAATPASAGCPPSMILVEGKYCPTALQRCLQWLDTGRYREWRCARYQAPAGCRGKRRALRFCIDRDEYVAPGQSLPLTGRTLVEAESLCKAENKRLCRESEWNFACEGEQMSPYPYGFERDSSACNADKPPRVGTDGSLVSLAQPPGSFPRCTSPFGVRDMTGNVEEWVRHDRVPLRGVLKGAYWTLSRNNCRAGQIHGPQYGGVELGFRCCAEGAK